MASHAKEPKRRLMGPGQINQSPGGHILLARQWAVPIWRQSRSEREKFSGESYIRQKAPSRLWREKLIRNRAAGHRQWWLYCACVWRGVGLLAESATVTVQLSSRVRCKRQRKRRKRHRERKEKKKTVLTGEKEPDGDLFCVQESVDFLCNLLPSARYSRLVSVWVVFFYNSPFTFSQTNFHSD